VGTDTAWYVYGVVPADTDNSVFEMVAGVAGGGVQLLSAGPLAAIAGEVPLAEFGEQPLRRNLENREWLESVVSAHDRVLAGALGTTPLVPLRFGTVYRGENGVRAMLDERAAELQTALERLRDRVELGVKAFYVNAAEADTPRPSSGRDYLLQKQRVRDAASVAQAEVLDSVRALHEHLTSLSDDARVNAPQPAELSGRREPMLLNAAYLVGTERQPAFADAVARHRDDRLELALTGPWPAYNFVDGDTGP
jgi:hypothetical protein